MPKKKQIQIEEIRRLAELPIAELLSESGENDGLDIIHRRLAACTAACVDGLGLRPFDEQITAAYALYNGEIIQMATGEGKTISAVFAAFLLSCEGRKVHILTFNDYLAERDYNWMKPIYDRLGTSIGCITANSGLDERKKAYAQAVLYSTAKECGFDYLKDFVADDVNDILLGVPHAVIVDEADSIMIDEARIPLVIAGSYTSELKKDLPPVAEFVKTLGADDYKIYEENKSVYLTDEGIKKAEIFFDDSELFSGQNSDLLTLIYNCLKAEFYLTEDKDYIVSENEILIVDEFTGRTVKNRHYPGILQSAVEAKHGLDISLRGTVMGTIPLQYFIRQYDFIAGMTGTAMSAAEEFELLYGLPIEEIPTHLPVRRIDHQTEVYFDSETKWNAIADEILSAHEKGQPVLIGTESIEESAKLAELLAERSPQIKTVVLNAKNDKMEAEIISKAGELGVVTISTNMAGRGVDILLGGADGKSREEVIAAGGLYVISTSMRESSRINNQLRGRAGRQGDIGESKVFTALDDKIMVKYELNKLIPKSRRPERTAEQITDKTVLREVERVQRIAEGDTLDWRKDLLRYTAIAEKHRKAIFGTRARYVRGESEPRIWQEYGAEDYEAAVKLHGKEKVDKLQLMLILHVINETWSEYLEFTDELRSGIHLTSVGGKSPSEEYNISCENYYNVMEEQVVTAMLGHLEMILQSEDIDEYKAEKPVEIHTYLSDERVENLVKKPLLANLLTTDEDDNSENGEKNDGNSNSQRSFFARIFKKDKEK